MARPLPHDLCARLAKLLPLLASDQAGEVTATAAAITRLLAGYQCDWHDLVAQLTLEPAPDRKRPRKSPASAAHPGSQAVDGQYIIDLIHAVRGSGCYLTKKAETFLAQLEERAATFGLVYFSRKQWEWFVSLLQEASVEMEA